jgi:hypothetical protein
MNPASPAVRPHRIWPWVVLVLLSPFAVLGIAAVSVLTLDSDARALRHEVMAASGAHWRTKVQCSVGGLVLGTARTALHFVHHKDVADARAALGAVRNASVGVYDLVGDEPEWSATRLFGRVDEVMSARGWTRLVGVEDHRNRVLIYSADGGDASERVDLCLAVVEDRQLVIVSTSVDRDGLASAVKQLSARHGHPLHLAGLF